MIEDKMLIWKLRKGDRSSLCRIYEKYRDDLLRIAAGLLTDTSQAEDTVHDAFISFIDCIGTFSVTGSLRGYLTTCVANRARNVNRAKARHREVGIDEIDPPAGGFDRPEQWLLQDEAFEQFRGAMAQLPYEQREAVILHVQGQMKFSTIAAMQQTSIKTVLSRYRYGITKLRSLLNGEVTV
ncbi:MAG: sigma-70 family RNA polymerase sigma factor [Planctomycetaceae bacterium]|nr:sigma-70 family RNA polymerase sigma factor [Planctomycetaceae bacterium]